MQGDTPCAFHNAADPFWKTQCADPAVCASFIPYLRSFYNASYYDAFIYYYTFNKAQWVLTSQQLQINGTGVWTFKWV